MTAQQAAKTTLPSSLALEGKLPWRKLESGQDELSLQMHLQADEEAALSEDLAETFLEMMLERLRDKQPAIRGQAALALGRLADPGEQGDFVGDGVTDSYIRLLGTEKNKVCLQFGDPARSALLKLLT